VTYGDKGFAKGACHEYEALLEDFLAGDLQGVGAERVKAHLGTCAACRDAFEEAAAGARLLKAAAISAGQAPEPGPAFARILMARIQAEGQPSAQDTKFWRPFVWLAWRFAATAALVVASLFTYATVWHGPVGGNNTMAGQTQTGDIFPPDPAQPPASRDEVLMMVAGSENGKN
jgi:hypothetical protein